MTQRILAKERNQCFYHKDVNLYIGGRFCSEQKFMHHLCDYEACLFYGTKDYLAPELAIYELVPNVTF